MESLSSELLVEKKRNKQQSAVEAEARAMIQSDIEWEKLREAMKSSKILTNVGAIEITKKLIQKKRASIAPNGSNAQHFEQTGTTTLSRGASDQLPLLSQQVSKFKDQRRVSWCTASSSPTSSLKAPKESLLHYYSRRKPNGKKVSPLFEGSLYPSDESRVNETPLNHSNQGNSSIAMTEQLISILHGASATLEDSLIKNYSDLQDESRQTTSAESFKTVMEIQSELLRKSFQDKQKKNVKPTAAPAGVTTTTTKEKMTNDPASRANCALDLHKCLAVAEESGHTKSEDLEEKNEEEEELLVSFPEKPRRCKTHSLAAKTA